MTSNELRQRYLNFFRSKGHTIIPSASLVPHETDASVLFTTAGMHPLVPYLLGAEHPGGKRVTNVQKCVRTGDIDDVGDNRHLTFFEMMGNWSFGDYFKKEAIEWSFEFLTDKEIGLGLDPNRLYVTTFKGEGNIPRDNDAIEIWKNVFKEKAGMEVEVAGDDEVVKDNVRIIPLGIDDNFWIAGATGPCGGDTEMFYDTRPEEGKLEGKFGDLVDTFRLIEIWNDVFMEFNKTEQGEYIKLEKPNVDTGMGVERTLMVLQGEYTVFETELFKPIFEKLESLSNSKYNDNLETKKTFRIIADHIKAASFMIADGVTPLNIGRGYVLRRLIRRAIRHGKLIGIENNFTSQISEVIIEMYKDFYNELGQNQKIILEELEKEEDKFRTTLEKGIKKIRKIIREILSDLAPIENSVLKLRFGLDSKKYSYQEISEMLELSEDDIDLMVGKALEKIKNHHLSGKIFNLYQQDGFPIELSIEEFKSMDINFEENVLNKIRQEFEEEMQKHQDLSRTASAGAFKGGLQGTGEMETRYHTANHLLLAALRQVLGEETYQKGSNITSERLRFDFNYPQKLSDEQIKQVEDLVNEKITENIPVEMLEMPKDEALKIAKVSFDPSKYTDIVKVYKIGDFSIELCGGPHVSNTGEIGKFKIVKEEASSAGIRRIKAIIE